ncbi:hypothetical protein [Arcanobacterium bovis]|uniref:Uncharacterized protein n=1 Tax=Arcanobacterium bovis TaxID=2529275 RepID=A0A4Q9V0D5_9ACTO|nr:hypothetical protein [Arcanobacterium bovis]TBW20872.1 hypothetical protein EZJ44_08060 [Arcanobacterium bovis]
MVTLPSDRYNLTESDRQTLLSAASVATAKCAREKLGIPWVGWRITDMADGKNIAFTEFGPWTKALATQNAFDNPSLTTTHTQKPANHPGNLNGMIPDDQVKKMRDTCKDEPDVSKFEFENIAPSGPWTTPLANTRYELMKDQRAQAVVKEIEQCYAEKGLQSKKEAPGYVEGFTAEDRTPQAFAAAIKAAECQEKLNATPRLVEIWAELQAPIITKYADELIAQRQKIDKTLSDAKEYINAHPELFELPK